MFWPGSSDPLRLDQAMRVSLADSLSYLHSAVGENLHIPEGDVQAAADKIRSHRVGPGMFGRYYKLVLAIEDGQHDQGNHLFRAIMTDADCAPTLSANSYCATALGNDRQLYADLIERDATGQPWLASPEQSFDCTGLVADAFAMVDAVDADLAQELRSLIVQVVGAAPSHLPGVQSFGSASSFMLWGLVLFNIERYRTALAIVPVLVHEAAHLLLYAHSIDEPLVTNPIEARYASPLRRDPRPMDGVFHATFVAARMHYVTHKLRTSEKLDLTPSEIAQLDGDLIQLRYQFAGGLETVDQFGMLTATGERILSETREYMKAA